MLRCSGFRPVDHVRDRQGCRTIVPQSGRVRPLFDPREPRARRLSGMRRFRLLRSGTTRHAAILWRPKLHRRSVAERADVAGIRHCPARTRMPVASQSSQKSRPRAVGSSPVGCTFRRDRSCRPLREITSSIASRSLGVLEDSSRVCPELQRKFGLTGSGGRALQRTFGSARPC